MSVTVNTFEDGSLEIRKLPVAKSSQLATILDINDHWKKLMSIIPRSSETLGPPYLYTSEDILLIHSTAKNRSCSPTDLLLSEWGITNRKRPTLSFLLDCLVVAEIFRAADLIAEFINVPPPQRPAHGPAARVNTSSVTDSMSRSPAYPRRDHLRPPIILDFDGAGIDRIHMGWLVERTNNFSPSNLIGEGSFGYVYKATLPAPWGTAAVKRLNEVKIQMWAEASSSFQSSSSSSLSSTTIADCGHPMQQFINEVKITSQVKHKNLLAMIGYSEEPYAPPCLVYEYMINGSLLAKLTDKTELGWETTMKIAQGTAEALHYLHSQPEPLIHRDVKSANILLDHHFNPKLGDYGLVRVGSNNTTRHTTKPIGTLIYMSPEATRGDLSVKMDVWSFGVVLLELVTGMPVVEENRQCDLLSIYQELDDEDRIKMWGQKEGWPPELPQKLLDIIALCFKGRKKDRPNMSDVISIFESIMMK